MNAQHSPAPWSLRGDVLRDANGVLLYRLTPLDEITIAEDMANRRLIESAPELYAALKELLDRRTPYCDFPSRCSLLESNSPTAAKAIALLAKVEGGA